MDRNFRKKEKVGRHCDTLVEPVGLVVSRTYEIQWKMQTFNIAELARMRLEERRGYRYIAKTLGIPKSTARDAVLRIEKLERKHK